MEAGIYQINGIETAKPLLQKVFQYLADVL